MIVYKLIIGNFDNFYRQNDQTIGLTDRRKDKHNGGNRNLKPKLNNVKTVYIFNNLRGNFSLYNNFISFRLR